MTSPDPLNRLRCVTDFAPPLANSWPDLREQLLAWHVHRGRHHLPWKTTDPYAVWLSEIMLQQTQVSTVLGYFEPWLTRFPTIIALADASEEAVLQAWEGLGYYSRARNLHRAAQQMRDQHEGQMPVHRADRLALPGVGPSTASAIGAFAFGQREAIFDGNVRRVWGRWLADRLPEPLTHRQRDQWLWSFAQAVMPEGHAAAWTQAIMDLGATVCTPRRPKCELCPLAATCQARLSGEPERYPPAVARPKVENWDLHWVWVIHQGRLAAVQRPATGIWGRLWALPEVALAPVKPPAHGRHVLTHRRLKWDIHVLTQLPSEIEVVWLDRATWEAQAQPVTLRRWWTGLSATEKEEWWKRPLDLLAKDN
jgi:A/G-specific adenine glycosylase